MAKSLYDLTIENNKKIYEEKADETGIITRPLSGAALENAQSESQYLSSTGGTSHKLYNLEATEDLKAQVAAQNKEASTLYELSKPTYGVQGKNLYDLGLNNSGYGKRLYDVNESTYKKNLYDIKEGEKTAQQEIAANTEALKYSNLVAYDKYLAKYSTVLDDYEAYEGKVMTEAQIQAQMLKDGYTADQINAVEMLRNERDLVGESGIADRDAVLSAYNEGKVSKEWAQNHLLAGYVKEDGAKVAADVKSGLISQEHADAWGKDKLKAMDEQGVYMDYNTLDEWQRLGLVSSETATEYKNEVNAKRANLAANAFDSEENTDKFLAMFYQGKGDPEAPSPDNYVGGEHSLAYKTAMREYEATKDILALGHIVDLAKTGVFASSGKNADEMIANAAKGYAEKIKSANENDAQMMLDEANRLYEEAKESGSPLTEELKKAVGGMYAEFSTHDVEKEFGVSAKDGFASFGNWAAAVLYGNAKAGGADFKESQEEAIKAFVEENDIKIYTVPLGGQSRNPQDYGVAYYISYNGKLQKAGQNMQVGESNFTEEQVDAIKEMLEEMGRFKPLQEDARQVAKLYADSAK